MKHLTLAVIALLAFSTPALAQNADDGNGQGQQNGQHKHHHHHHKQQGDQQGGQQGGQGDHQ